MTPRWLALLLAFALATPAVAEESVARDLGPDGFGTAGGHPWEQARDRLLVELRPATTAQATNAIFRQDIPHTRTALILLPEDPEAPPYDVTLADALEWQRDGDELFAIALANLAREFPPEVRKTPKLAEGTQINLFYDERPYAAGHAIEMEKRKACRGRNGSLVAIPNAYAMLCYPINSEQALHGYLALVQLSATITQDGLAPLVPHIYWFDRGQWEAQRVSLEEDGIGLSRTPNFDALMKGLAPKKPDVRKRRW